jgi:feruloyl-CoA synthase
MGDELKLVPQGDKLEARLRGPLITPGYWRNPNLTAEAFDEEGFYKLRRRVALRRAGRSGARLLFDGRWPRTSSSTPAPGSRWGRCAPR